MTADRLKKRIDTVLYYFEIRKGYTAFSGRSMPGKANLQYYYSFRASPLQLAQLPNNARGRRETHQR